MSRPSSSFFGLRLPRLSKALALVGLTLASGLHAEAVTTEVTFNDPAGTYAAFYAPIASNVKAGMNNWTASLPQNLTVRVVVRFTGDGAGGPSTGRSVTNAYFHKDGGRNVYMEGLAAKLTGLIPAGNTAPDVDIYVNPGSLASELWFDPQPDARTAAVPGDKTDAVSLFTSLLGHALGFNGFYDQTTHTLPGDYVSAFDEQIVSSGSGFLFDGSSAAAVYGGPVPLYSGYLYSLGNRAPQPGSNLLGDVMNGVALARGQRYSVSALDRAILKDTGLDLPAVAGTPAVTLAVTSPTATIGGQPAMVVFRLAAQQGQDTAIRYQVKGDAVSGVDYAALSGTVKIKAGKISKTLKVQGTGDLNGAAKKKLKLTLLPGAGYTVGTPETVKVKIVAGQ